MLFGADLGISRTQELMDEGVDKDTAINAGMVTFGTAALGMRLPATFGRSRIASATIGAAANAGLTAAEMQGVNWVLQNQNYDELAQKYQLNGIDLTTSAIFGGVMGGVLWRPGMNNGRPQTAQERSVALQERIKRQLREASPEHLTDEQIDYQARVHATGIQVMADRAQIDTDAIAPEIVRGESTDGLNQIIGERGASALDSADETTIRLDNRDVAESMEGDGKTPEQIRLATGWERGADGQWRYEIPDIQIKEGAFRVIYEADAARDAEQAALWERTDLSENEYVDQDIAIANKYENQTLTTKLDEVVDAPELFRAYPQLKDLTVEFGQLPRMVGAYYDAAAKVIRLDRRSDILQRNTRSNLAHEIQHAIQDIEGFARGSNLEENSFANALRADLEPLYVMMQDSEAWKIYQEMEDQASELMDDALMARADEYADNPEIQAIFREQQRLRDKYGINHDVLEAIADYHPTNDRIWQTIHENHLDYARQRYSRSAGEVEARNVQDRLDMTNEQRRQSTLESTESYPRNEQIVRYGDNLYRDSSVSIDEQIGNIERIADWLSDDNLNWAKGKSYQEIIAHFGNEPQPVAFIPKEWLTKLFGEEIADNRVYSGKAYFIDHAVNHHPEDIDLEAYVLMQEMISKNTEAIIDDRKGKKGVIFVKQYDKNYLLAVELRQEDDGKIHLYKSLSKTRSKKPYPNLRRARLPVDALNSLRDEPSQYIRTSEEAHGGRRFSALDNSTDIVGQNANDVNEFVPDSELIQRAKDTFGITNDVREAFYVLPDGTMLDGSGRHWGGSEIDVAGQRQVDHGDIAEIIDDSTNPADAMYKWMARSGAMRFDQIVGIASIARKPTPQQLAVLSRASRGKYLALSFNTPEGRIVDDVEFESASPVAIRHFFEDAQIKAANGVAGAFAQRAWHGSPHTFDRFSTEHIGTGEGAQAHGWGLYFAADQEVAEGYRERLADDNWWSEWSVNGHQFGQNEDEDFKFLDSYFYGSENVLLDLLHHISLHKSGKVATPKQLQQAFDRLYKEAEESEFIYESDRQEYFKGLEKLRSELDSLQITRNKPGRVFEVEIPDPAVMLDEDKLIEDQTYIKHQLKRKAENGGNRQFTEEELPDYATGRDLYEFMSGVLGSPKEASLYLNSAGIKGITYEGRRDGRCYVVFDDKAIQTIEYFQRQMQEGTGATRGSFDPVRNLITLTANANISTYSHEMGHWYLENLFQLSKRASADSTLKEDAETLLKEFGVKSIDDWDNLGIDGQRKFHEQFASWMEIYLTEGRAPKPTLQRVFERLGQWLVDLYRELGGVKKAVGDTYKAEVGEELPPVSEEVAKVLDRLFANDRAVRKASRVSKSQVAAARMVQANRTNNNKLEEIIAMPNGKEKTRALRDLEKSTKAQLKAIQAMKRGLPVDVSQDVEQMNVDVDHLVEMKGNFGRAYVMGNTDSAVVLQNRDRSDVGSIGQMNAIAANPQYGLVSVSRSYSGAPVVSYGSVPDSAHLGNNDFIVETNGNRVPFMYAVVEAGDVETSNFIDGSTNTGYGNPQRMNAVVGNGRMTALKEAYNRGTANQYRTDLEADTAHGIQPEVIQKMKNPVLVRVINPEDVTTGFISRSNGQQVLALDDVEVAREDAPKIRARAGQYEFDEAGNPTNDTLALFIQDLHDPNALGRLITSDGRPTPEAVRRIRNAVFFEAYQSPELSALFSQEVDPGIRRILNGLANVAPRIIELREQAQELDFSNLLVEAANRIRQARLNTDEGVDFASQMSFLDNPATSAFVEFLDDNANSAVAIARTLNPLIDWAENAAQAADGGLFGGDAEVHVDLADVVGQLRNIINDQRAGAGLEPLPEIDVNALRDQIQTTVDTVAQAVDEVNARIEAETQQAEMDIANEAQALDAQRQQSLAVLDEKSSVDARAQFLMEQNPDQVYRVLDENGMEVQGTLNDLLAQADDEVRQAEIEAAGIGRAVECVLRNGGI